MGLRRRLTEITTHLGRGDRVDDAALDHLISKLEGGPVRDRASGLLGRFAGDGEDLDDLLRGKLAGGAWAWFVGEDRFDGPSHDGAGLTALDVNESVPRVGPAPSPASDLAMCHADSLGDVLIEKAVEGRHNDRGALPEPLECGDGTRKGLKDFLLTLGDGDLGRLARLGKRTPGDWKASEAG